jgi:hypothetical protein
MSAIIQKHSLKLKLKEASSVYVKTLFQLNIAIGYWYS